MVNMDLHARFSSNGTGSAKKSSEIRDSWEEEADEANIEQSIPSAQPMIPQFRNLTRLSLGHPGASASWPELLKISPNLHKVTHLSLAYWPRPTLTPNAVTTSMVSSHGKSINLSGTPYYSDLDEDYHEATSILRRFSANTYSLEWLDLEGCTWLKALTFAGATFASARDWEVSGYRGLGPNTGQHPVMSGLDWNESWQRVQYIHVFQGWIPADNMSLTNMPAGMVVAQLLRWLREHQTDGAEQWKLNYQESGHAVQQWVEREKMARTVGAELRLLRKQRMGSYIKLDHGWE